MFPIRRSAHQAHDFFSRWGDIDCVGFFERSIFFHRIDDEHERQANAAKPELVAALWTLYDQTTIDMDMAQFIIEYAWRVRIRDQTIKGPDGKDVLRGNLPWVIPGDILQAFTHIMNPNSVLDPTVSLHHRLPSEDPEPANTASRGLEPDLQRPGTHKITRGKVDSHLATSPHGSHHSDSRRSSNPPQRSTDPSTSKKAAAVSHTHVGSHTNPPSSQFRHHSPTPQSYQLQHYQIQKNQYQYPNAGDFDSRGISASMATMSVAAHAPPPGLGSQPAFKQSVPVARSLGRSDLFALPSSNAPPAYPQTKTGTQTSTSSGLSTPLDPNEQRSHERSLYGAGNLTRSSSTNSSNPNPPIPRLTATNPSQGIEKCPFADCDLLFSNECMAKHWFKCHSDAAENSVPCPYQGCDEGFKTITEMSSHHARTRHVPNDVLECIFDGCSQTFESMQDWKKHYWEDHKYDVSDLADFQCHFPGCKSEGFKRKLQLQRHLTECHLSVEQKRLRGTNYTEKGETEGRLFSCSTCGKNFSSKGNLGRHQTTCIPNAFVKKDTGHSGRFTKTNSQNIPISSSRIGVQQPVDAVHQMMAPPLSRSETQQLGPFSGGPSDTPITSSSTGAQQLKNTDSLSQQSYITPQTTASRRDRGDTDSPDGDAQKSKKAKTSKYSGGTPRRQM